MKKIVVAYWGIEKNPIPHFQNNSVFDYTGETQSKLIHIIIESGFSIMLKPNMGVNRDTLLVYISKDTFD